MTRWTLYKNQDISNKAIKKPLDEQLDDQFSLINSKVYGNYRFWKNSNFVNPLFFAGIDSCRGIIDANFQSILSFWA